MNQLKTRSRWLSPETLAASVGMGVLVTIVGRMAGLGRGIVFAHGLDPSELGAWSLAFNAINLTSLVLVMGLPGGIARYAEVHRRAGTLRPFLLWTAGATLAITLAVTALSCWYLSDVSFWLFQEPGRESLTVLVLAAIVATVVFNVLQGLFQGLRLTRLIAVLQTAQMVGFALFGMAVLNLWRSDAVGATAAMLVSLVALVVILYALIGRGRGVPAGEVLATEAGPAWNMVVWYSLGTWAAGGVGEVTRLVDRWFLVHNKALDVDTGLQMVGSYHLVENITQPLLSLAVQVSIFVLPHAVYLWESRQPDATRRLVQTTTKFTALILFFICAGLVFFKPLLLGVIFKDRAGYAADVFAFLLAAMIITASNFMARSYLFCREQARPVVWSTVVGLGVAVAANLVLIPWLHLRGAALAALLAAWISTATLLVVANRQGLRAQADLWIAVLVLPLTLALPPVALGVLVLIVLVVVLATNVLVDVDEKEWFGQRFAPIANRVLPGWIIRFGRPKATESLEA